MPPPSESRLAPRAAATQHLVVEERRSSETSARSARAAGGRSCSGRRPPRRSACTAAMSQALTTWSSAASTAPSATRTCCQKSPKPRACPGSRQLASGSVRSRRGDGDHGVLDPRDARDTAARVAVRVGAVAAPRPPAPAERRRRHDADRDARRPARARSASPRRDPARRSSACRRSGRGSSGARSCRRAPCSSPSTPSSGPLALEQVEQRALDRAVGVGDGGQVGLRLDAQVERAEAGERDRVGGVGQLERESEVGVHERHPRARVLLEDLELRLGDDDLDRIRPRERLRALGERQVQPAHAVVPGSRLEREHGRGRVGKDRIGGRLERIRDPCSTAPRTRARLRGDPGDERRAVEEPGRCASRRSGGRRSRGRRSAGSTPVSVANVTRPRSACRSAARGRLRTGVLRQLDVHVWTVSAERTNLVPDGSAPL